MRLIHQMQLQHQGTQDLQLLTLSRQTEVLEAVMLLQAPVECQCKRQELQLLVLRPQQVGRLHWQQQRLQA
jgi:hypothetical protein